LSPVRRRATVEHVQRQLSVSERRVCRALSQPRSSQRYAPAKNEEEKRLVGEMLTLVGRHPRFGYRRIGKLLRRAGWRVNPKRIYRLWVREGLKVPQKQRKKRRLGQSANSCIRRKAEHKDHVWTWDFLHDRTTGGRPLKWLSIIDEYTRECLALEVDRGITSEKAIDVLADLFRIRGVPKHIRCDNGPEFIAKALRRWLAQAGVETLYVEPGSPWENGYVESFHSRLRDELTNREEFMNLAEARHLADAWRLEYNHRRPHSSLDYQTPAEFATGCAASVSVAALPPLQQHSRNPLPVTQSLLS
jgi:putative transposase